MERHDDNEGTHRPGSNLSRDELAAEAAVDLPAREAMTTIDGVIADNLAMPINEATAVNVESDYSIAIADADQYVIVDQTDTVDTTSAPVDDLQPGHGNLKR